MPDIENVIKGLEHCSVMQNCLGCPYFKVDPACQDDLCKDALELLKKHNRPDCEHAEHDGVGCLGYSGCIQDDEPIDACKNCDRYTGNIVREW